MQNYNYNKWYEEKIHAAIRNYIGRINLVREVREDFSLGNEGTISIN